jgi:hypothetical protein
LLSQAAGGSGSLVGTYAGVANRRLTAMFLDAGLNEIEGSLGRFLGADVLNIASTGVSPEIQNLFSGYKGFLLATEIEYGRYFGTKVYSVLTLNPARFSSGTGGISPVGLRFEYRLANAYRIETTFGPRFLLTSQSLQLEDPKSLQNFGVFLSREWKW